MRWEWRAVSRSLKLRNVKPYQLIKTRTDRFKKSFISYCPAYSEQTISIWTCSSKLCIRCSANDGDVVSPTVWFLFYLFI